MTDDDTVAPAEPDAPLEPVDVIDKLEPGRTDFTVGLQAVMADHGNPVQIRTGVLIDHDGAQPVAYFTLADSSVYRVVFMPERTTQLAGTKSRALARILRDEFAPRGISVTNISTHPLPRHMRRKKGPRRAR